MNSLKTTDRTPVVTHLRPAVPGFERLDVPGLDEHWHVERSCAGKAWTDYRLYFQGSQAGSMRLFIVEVFGDEDDVLADLADADIWCVQDELEAFLLEHPGSYVWMDSLERCSDAPEVKGKLTRQVRQVLRHAVLRLPSRFQGLAFPCPYGVEDGWSLEAQQSAESPARSKLTQWYARELQAVGARPDRPSPLVVFPL